MATMKSFLSMALVVCLLVLGMKSLAQKFDNSSVAKAKYAGPREIGGGNWARSPSPVKEHSRSV
jgi:hypothetical protein